MFQYSENFYKFIEETKNDEQIIMPLILQWVSPVSIVDFGCAEGAWLGEALRQNNDIEILGMDGDYINKERLKIPKECFRAVDLRQNILMEKRYDLAISTEVAEHLEEEFADIFIDNITKASDQVLFSAAIPGQGGTHHVNEQWQSYWVEKFRKRGYFCDYSVRNYFWNELKISSWRKQNLLFFSKKETQIAPPRPLTDLMHPQETIIKQKYYEGKIHSLEYYIFHSEILIGLEKIIKNLLNKKKRIVIYPYGNNGRLCERILCEKYGVKNYMLADNLAVVEEKTILKAEQLKEMRNKISVIETCSNSLIHKEVLRELQKYVDSENIYSVLPIEDS